MCHHLNFTKPRTSKGVYTPHPAKALLPQNMSIPYVFRRRQVCIPPVATGHTLELQTNTVPLSNVPASWASLGRICRIDDCSFYALLSKLIARLELQRCIRPSADFLTKVLSFLQRSFSDIAEVFEHDYPSSNFLSITGQVLRGNMQEMFRNGPFAVCQTSFQTSGTPGTYGLNRGSSKSDTFSQVVQTSAGKEKSFTVGGVRGDKHTLDAGIHSYNASLSFKVRNFFFIAKKQIHFIFDNFKFRVLPRIGWDVGISIFYWTWLSYKLR